MFLKLFTKQNDNYENIFGKCEQRTHIYAFQLAEANDQLIILINNIFAEMIEASLNEIGRKTNENSVIIEI